MLRHLLTLALATAVSSYYFGDLMWQPNQTAPTFGGDGLTIHYNLQYHATHGRGVYLRSQYHPYAESIFLTDAQGMVAVTLAALRPVFPNIGDHAVGISNALIFWSNVLAALLLYLVLLRLGVGWPLATWLGIVIALMAPPIVRQLGGQYSLGFSFLLPLILLYQVSYRGQGYTWWSAGVLLVVIALGLNNPYLYAITALYLLGGAVAGAVWTGGMRGRWTENMPLQWAAVAILATGVIYAIIKSTDHVDDRVLIPFGFFKNVMHWGGLLTSPGVFSGHEVRNILPGLYKNTAENAAYLGLVPILFGLTLPISLWLARRRGALDWRTRRLGVMGLGAGVALLFAFGLPLKWFPEFAYEHLRLVLQFRAPARFAWPFYYVLAVATGFGLHGLYRLVGHRIWGGLLVAVFMGVWSFQAHQYLTARLHNHVHFNALVPWRTAELRAAAEDLGLDTATYAGIYLLPSEQGWTDKTHIDGSWRSNFEGYRLSVVSGLPLLNGKLTRVSLSRSLASVQLISHPAIPRVLLDRLDPDKDILLLVSKENNLLPGEERLRKQARLLWENEVIELRSISPAEIAASVERARKALAPSADDGSKVIHYVSFDSHSGRALHGTGGRALKPDWQTVAKLPLEPHRRGDTLHLSFWYYVDRSRFGGPTFYAKFEDADGNALGEQKQWANRATDTWRGWLRLTYALTVPERADRLVVIGRHDFPYTVDELYLLTEPGIPTLFKDRRTSR